MQNTADPFRDAGTSIAAIDWPQVPQYRFSQHIPADVPGVHRRRHSIGGPQESFLRSWTAWRTNAHWIPHVNMIKSDKNVYLK